MADVAGWFLFLLCGAGEGGKASGGRLRCEPGMVVVRIAVNARRERVRAGIARGYSTHARHERQNSVTHGAMNSGPIALFQGDVSRAFWAAAGPSGHSP